ncbi:unnamed protein product [Heligmosomoides polygyrus]|uniref:PI3K/PI4K domain-containing protein n=1 Tax=Heligmosomoides polygyrus TaxID=6339 RepID=A0A183GF99_HELPZ|nr:unnamed protein product [Heligmosomoides polygyrus]
MGRITTIYSSREVELLSSKGRTIKKPFNLLIPLELEHHSEEEGLPPSRSEKTSTSKYNLRRQAKHQNSDGRTTLDFASVNVVSSACQHGFGYDVTFNLSYTVPGYLIYLKMAEGARRFLEELAVITRKNFCEEDVQGLEYHYDQLGSLLD